MVKTYDILQLIEGNLLDALVKKGVVPITYLDYKKIYENYQKQRENHPKMQAYENTAIECYVSVTTVREVVKRMES